MTATSRCRVRATAVRLFGEDVGCHDGSCVFGHTGGMQTNGGCQCLDQARAGGRDAVLLVRRLAQLADALAEGTP